MFHGLNDLHGQDSSRVSHRPVHTKPNKQLDLLFKSMRKIDVTNTPDQFLSEERTEAYKEYLEQEGREEAWTKLTPETKVLLAELDEAIKLAKGQNQVQSLEGKAALIKSFVNNKMLEQIPVEVLYDRFENASLLDGESTSGDLVAQHLLEGEKLNEFARHSMKVRLAAHGIKNTDPILLDSLMKTANSNSTQYDEKRIGDILLEGLNNDKDTVRKRRIVRYLNGTLTHDKVFHVHYPQATLSIVPPTKLNESAAVLPTNELEKYGTRIKEADYLEGLSGDQIIKLMQATGTLLEGEKPNVKILNGLSNKQLQLLFSSKSAQHAHLTPENSLGKEKLESFKKYLQNQRNTPGSANLNRRQSELLAKLDYVMGQARNEETLGTYESKLNFIKDTLSPEELSSIPIPALYERFSNNKLTYRGNESYNGDKLAKDLLPAEQFNEYQRHAVTKRLESVGIKNTDQLFIDSLMATPIAGGAVTEMETALRRSLKGDQLSRAIFTGVLNGRISSHKIIRTDDNKLMAVPPINEGDSPVILWAEHANTYMPGGKNADIISNLSREQRALLLDSPEIGATIRAHLQSSSP